MVEKSSFDIFVGMANIASGVLGAIAIFLVFLQEKRTKERICAEKRLTWDSYMRLLLTEATHTKTFCVDFLERLKKKEFEFTLDFYVYQIPEDDFKEAGIIYLTYGLFLLVRVYNQTASSLSSSLNLLKDFILAKNCDSELFKNLLTQVELDLTKIINISKMIIAHSDLYCHATNMSFMGDLKEDDKIISSFLTTNDPTVVAEYCDLMTSRRNAPEIKKIFGQALKKRWESVGS